MDAITTPNAPQPAGHYAQAVAWDRLVFVAGQLPVRPNGEHVTGDIEAQTRQALANVEAILNASGSGLDRVLKTTVFVTDVALWPAVNTMYAEVFGEHRPARSVVPVKELHYGFLIEIEAIAVRD
ncbi:MAG: RidA family protein [Cytophagales bacterium]|nr:MAG: RidA family protein [Cytophagales bacterium]